MYWSIKAPSTERKLLSLSAERVQKRVVSYISSTLSLTVSIGLNLGLKSVLIVAPSTVSPSNFLRLRQRIGLTCNICKAKRWKNIPRFSSFLDILPNNDVNSAVSLTRTGTLKGPFSEYPTTNLSICVSWFKIAEWSKTTR